MKVEEGRELFKVQHEEPYTVVYVDSECNVFFKVMCLCGNASYTQAATYYTVRCPFCNRLLYRNNLLETVIVDDANLIVDATP